MRPFAIAGLQLQVSAVGGNMPLIKASVDHLVHLFPWVQMVLLSELAVDGAARSRAEPLPGPTERAFQELAKKHEVWLVNGSAYELRDEQVFNTCSVIDPSGRVIGRYRKMFPFRPYEERVEPGTDFLVFDVPDAGRFGVSICYDMWFPEHSRTLAAMGAEVILHPSMTPTIDRDVELSIAVATAATNQCYVFDVNGAGGGGVGHSIVVGPDGHVLHKAGSAHELIPMEIDLDQVSRSRRRGLRGLGQPLKAFRDAPVRFEVYDPDSPLRRPLDALGAVEKPLRRAHGKKTKPRKGEG